VRLYVGAMLTKTFAVEAADPLAIARALKVPVGDIALRLGVTSDWTRRLAADAKTAPKVTRAVLQLALEADRLEAMLS
jgi:hypothetical protein